jgi:hypothetical protein
MKKKKKKKKRKIERSRSTKAADGWWKRIATVKSTQFCFNVRHNLSVSEEREKHMFEREGRSIDFGVEVQNLEVKENKKLHYQRRTKNGVDWREL